MIFIDRHVAASITFAGLLLGVLGVFYLVYDLLGRHPKWLQKGLWNFSSGMVVAFALIAIYVILFEARILSLQVSLGDLVRVGWVIGMFAVIIQFLKLQDIVSKPNPPLFIWQNMLIPIIYPGSGIGALGAFFGGAIGGLVFGIVGAVVTGLLAGFAQGLQWRANHLPEKRLAVIGALLIGGGLVLILVQPVVDIFN